MKISWHKFARVYPEFTKTARIYEAKGSYTEFPPGSKPYKDF